MKNWLKISALLISTQLIFSVALAEKFRYDRHEKRDPFFVSAERPQANEANTQTPSNFKIEGVIIDPGGASMAIIDGTIIKLGEQVGIHKVKKITKEGVLFSDGEKDFWVAIRTEE